MSEQKPVAKTPDVRVELANGLSNWDHQWELYNMEPPRSTEPEPFDELIDRLYSGIIQPLIEAAKKNPAPVVCLCGSTRFTREMLVKQWELTKQGNIVVSWCALPDDYFQCEDKDHIGDQEGIKEIVDAVHMRKIDLCDEVLVLNVGDHIGESTHNEIVYAEKIGKPVKYIEATEPICTDCHMNHDNCPDCCDGDLYLSPDSYEKFEDR